MRPHILLPIVVAVSIAACRARDPVMTPDSPLASEIKLLERQVAALQTAVADAKRGDLFRADAIAVGVSEEVVQSALSHGLPIERAVGTEFKARIEGATVSFRSMQGSVKLEGRVWALANPETFADLELLGGIGEVAIDQGTGMLTATIVLDGWDVRRAAAIGAESEWVRELVLMLGEQGLSALRELVPDVRIPVQIERGIDLPGVKGGVVTIPSGRLPLDASVSRVLPLSGRLWAMVNVMSTGWRPTDSRSSAGPAKP